MSDYIPEDIQLIILKHLPVCTLVRSRCVCKWWKQVIDSQSFIQDHLANQKRYLILEHEASKYLVTDPCELPFFEIISSPVPERLHFLGTLHGVICLFDDNWSEIVLWNPWIRKLMRVSLSDPSFDWYDYNNDPLGPSCGFWIDPSTKEFKVIMFKLSEPYMDEEQDDQCGIYSSVRGDWKKIPLDEELESFYTKESSAAVVIGNVGHWTVYYTYTDGEGQDVVGVLVLLFDFKQEVFLESIEALHIHKGRILPVLCDRDGVLSLVYIDHENSYDIFSWKDGKWVLIYGYFVFPVLEKYMWREGDKDDRERKSRVLAAITGLLLLEPEDLILCTPMMIHLLKVNDIVVANRFVASLLFPDAEC